MSKKRVYGLLGGVLSIGLLLGACGGEKDSASTKANGEKKEVIEFKLGHTINPDSHYQEMSEKFAQLVEEKSDGSIKVNIFPQGQLGGEVQMIQAGASGTLEMFITAQAPLVNSIKEYSIFDLPYLFDDLEQANKVLQGPVGGKYLDMLDNHGLVGLGFMSAIERDTFTSEPIESPEDFKGKKMRVIQSPGYVSAYEALGAQPTPMAYPEVYLSVQQGVIDGGELSADQYVMDKFLEVSKYFNRTKVHFLPALLVISKSVFEELTPEQQTAVKEAAEEATKYDIELYKKTLEDSLKIAKDAGKTIVEPDIAPFKDATQKVYDKLLKEIPNGKELLQEIEDAKKE